MLLWVDTNYEKYQREGLPVECPEKISGAAYEQVLVAVAKKELAEEIKEKLNQMGIPGHRILWICPVKV